MSRFNNRSSTSNVDFYPAERWDREKFERYRRRPEDTDVFRFHERETPTRREVDVLDRDVHRGPHGRVEEHDFRYHEEDVKRRGGSAFGGTGGRRAEFLHEPSPAEVAERALEPYRRRGSVVEREREREREIAIHPGPPAPRRPARPMMLRRSSSMDTFDRVKSRPYPRYGEREREAWRPPTNVGIPLPYRRSPSPKRRGESRSSRYKEEEFEEVRLRERDRDEEYRDVRIHRERSRRRRGSGSRYAESESSFEEISPVRDEPKLPGKKGRTKMPKRLVHIKAIEKLGYPYEEEEDFIFVKRALHKEQIDEVIEISKTFRESEKTTYRYEETVEKKEEVIEEPKHVAPVEIPAPPKTVYEEKIEESAHIGGPLTIVTPRGHHHHRTTDDIRREITSLEAEKRALNLEREAENKLVLAERIRDGEYVDEYEWVERDVAGHRRKDIIRVEKDRKVLRSKSRRRKRVDPAAVALAVATLS